MEFTKRSVMVTFEISSFVMENCTNTRKYGTFKFEFYDSLCKELYGEYVTSRHKPLLHDKGLC